MTVLQLLLWLPEKMKDGLSDYFYGYKRRTTLEFVGNKYGTYDRKFIKTT